MPVKPDGSLRRGLQLSLLAASVALAGCASNGDGDKPHRISSADAEALNAEQSSFENAEDPPLKAATFFAAGQLNETQGHLKEAAKQYENAAKLDPKNATTLYRLGVVYATLKDYPKAIGAWERYIAATDNSATGYSNLGFCQELAGQSDAAAKSYRKGIDIDPKNRPCRVNYGLMLARDNRINEATIQLQAVLSPAEVHYNLGSVFQQQKKIDRARAEYRKALELNPKMEDAKARLAELK